MQTDIAIIGGGLAGSSLAAMLGRAGIDAVLIDPRRVYPPDFRCEKLDAMQIEVLRKTGLDDVFLPATTFPEDLWIARYGRLLDRRPNDQCDFFYETAVNTIRTAVPESVPFLETKANAIETSDERQRVVLASGEVVSARLVVLANGLNVGLAHTLGIERRVLSPAHSISIGFNIAPASGSFPFSSLTYYPERVRDRAAYLTLFPIGRVMRANLFVYRDMDDPWLTRMRREPVAALAGLMPGLARFTGPVTIGDDVKIRPVDLYAVEGHLQPGVVLAGDVHSTSCPAAGTGAYKALVDAERLAHRHIPEWLASPGMGREKIAAFYADPEKLACETFCRDKAFRLRSLSIEPGPAWLARRLTRFGVHWARGRARAAREMIGAGPGGPGYPGAKGELARRPN